MIKRTLKEFCLNFLIVSASNFFTFLLLILYRLIFTHSADGLLIFLIQAALAYQDFFLRHSSYLLIFSAYFYLLFLAVNNYAYLIRTIRSELRVVRIHLIGFILFYAIMSYVGWFHQIRDQVLATECVKVNAAIQAKPTKCILAFEAWVYAPNIDTVITGSQVFILKETPARAIVRNASIYEVKPNRLHKFRLLELSQAGITGYDYRHRYPNGKQQLEYVKMVFFEKKMLTFSLQPFLACIEGMMTPPITAFTVFLRCDLTGIAKGSIITVQIAKQQIHLFLAVIFAVCGAIIIKTSVNGIFGIVRLITTWLTFAITFLVLVSNFL